MNNKELNIALGKLFNGIELDTHKVDLALMDDIKNQYKTVKDTNRKLLDIKSDFLKKRKALISFSEILNEQSKRLLELCNDIEQQLSEVETREEAEEIFKYAVIKLDKYGLLGDLSIEESQKLVQGNYREGKSLRFLEKELTKNQESEGIPVNVFCLVALRGCAVVIGIISLLGIALVSILGYAFFPLFLFFMFLFDFQNLKIKHKLDYVAIIDPGANILTVGLYTHNSYETNYKLLGFTGLKISFDYYSGDSFLIGSSIVAGPRWIDIF